MTHPSLYSRINRSPLFPKTLYKYFPTPVPYPMYNQTECFLLQYLLLSQLLAPNCCMSILISRLTLPRFYLWTCSSLLGPSLRNQARRAAIGRDKLLQLQVLKYMSLLVLGMEMVQYSKHSKKLDSLLRVGNPMTLLGRAHWQDERQWTQFTTRKALNGY